MNSLSNQVMLLLVEFFYSYCYLMTCKIMQGTYFKCSYKIDEFIYSCALIPLRGTVFRYQYETMTAIQRWLDIVLY